MEEYRMRIDSPHADLYRIRVGGALDAGTGARVLRQVDARLRLIDDGSVRTRHILVDLTGVPTATPQGVRALPHGHYAAGRRGVGFHLIGAGRLRPGLGPAAHALLGRINGFPDLESAVQALTSPAPVGVDGDPGAVAAPADVVAVREP